MTTSTQQRPRVRSISHDVAAGPWSVDFGRAHASVTLDHDGGVSVYHWRLRGPGIDLDGESQSSRFALLSMACAAAEPPPSLGLSELEVARLVRKSEVSVDDAIEVFRDLLLRRTGLRWSVRRGRRASAQDITIKAKPDRMRDGVMTFDDAVLLASVTGGGVVVPSVGVRVIHGRGRRAEIVRMLAGPAVKAESAVCA